MTFEAIPRRNVLFIVLILIGLVSMPISIQAKGTKEISMQRETFDQWENAWVLDNGQCRMTAVPEIARVMEFAPKGGKSLFWVNPELVGKNIGSEVHAGQDCPNFGGYKIWCAPQSIWKWPPDPWIDGLPCRTEMISTDTLRMTGQPSPVQGVRFSRELRMHPDRARVDVRQTIENVSDTSRKWGIWEITAVVPEARVFMPNPGPDRVVGSMSFAPGQYKLAECKHAKFTDASLFFRFVPGVLPTDGKIHIHGTAGWLACELDGQVYAKRFAVSPREAYPDQHANTEIFLCKDFTEIETVSPEFQLSPGATADFSEQWLLFEVEPNLSDADLFDKVSKRIAEN
jgi:hypothetical protein